MLHKAITSPKDFLFGTYVDEDPNDGLKGVLKHIPLGASKEALQGTALNVAHRGIDGIGEITKGTQNAIKNAWRTPSFDPDKLTKNTLKLAPLAANGTLDLAESAVGGTVHAVENLAHSAANIADHINLAARKALKWPGKIVNKITESTNQAVSKVVSAITTESHLVNRIFTAPTRALNKVGQTVNNVGKKVAEVLTYTASINAARLAVIKPVEWTRKKVGSVLDWFHDKVRNKFAIQ